MARSENSGPSATAEPTWNQESAGQLDRRSYTPLYVQLTDLLIRRIRRGEFPPGAAFLSERELSQRYGVSAITSRRVLADLARDGLLERRTGVGTFVRANRSRVRVSLLVFEFKEAPDAGHRMIASAFGELVGGVAQAAWEANASLNLAYLAQPDDLTRWLDDAASTSSVDGVLVRAAGDVADDELRRLEASGLPFVLIKRHVPGHPAWAVIADEAAAVRLSVEHLVALGHRAIGFVASTQSAVLYQERLRGYREALASAGLSFDESLVATAPDFSADGGASAAHRLLSSRRVRPTGLMVASDSMAIGAYRAAAERGLAIPDDLSVASVDDIPEAQALVPSLTTARTSHVEFGVRAVRLLLRAVEARRGGASMRPQEDVIEPTLVVRQSTAPPLPAR
jgi:LacI family transcriptional regulator